MTRTKITILLDKITAEMVVAEVVHGINVFGNEMELVYPGTLLTEKLVSRLKDYKVERVTVFDNNDNNSEELDFLKIPENNIEIRENVELPPKLPNYIVHKDRQKEAAPNVVPQPYKPLLDEGIKKESISRIQNLFSAVEKGLNEDGTDTTAFQVVNDMGNVVNKLVEVISSKPKELIHISDLKDHDEYTYHHSLSVAVLSMAIGNAMGMNNWQLKGLGLCAIMHDIGKIEVPREIILKPDKLTVHERAVIQQHAVLGYEYMRRNNIGNVALMEGVMHHHEKYDGSGYPSKLKGQKIPKFSRIISVADVYDALTSNRPYRQPMQPPSQAVEMIMSEVGTSFDYDIVDAFVRKYEIYPVDSHVILSNNRQGIVIGYLNSMRPVVRMSDNGEVLDLALTDNLNLIVTKAWK